MEARGLTLALGGKTILESVDFTAAPGEVTAIVGPNGAGKTTLLKALSGELKGVGPVRLNGTALTDLRGWQVAEMRGVLPQASALAFPFTVIEVVRIGLSSGRGGGDDRRALQALARVDLAGFAGRYYNDLSGGEQQRVQLARVLTQIWEPMSEGQPRWLLLDEPVASLDVGHQFTVMDIARDFAASGGGVIAVMHDLNLTAMFADKVWVMHRGRVAASGAPRDTLTTDLMQTIYGCPLQVNTVPPLGIPFVLPQTRVS